MDKGKKDGKQSILLELLRVIVKSKTFDERKRAQNEVKKYFESFQTTQEEGATLMDELNDALTTVCEQEGIANEKVAHMINFLIENTENDSRKIVIFAGFLRQSLSSYKISDLKTLAKITTGVGRLAKASTKLKTLTPEWVQFEAKRALEWVETKDKRMFAALLVLKELAENSPTFFFPLVGDFLKTIWIGLRDADETIRATSAQALKPALFLVSERYSPDRIIWWNNLWEQIKEGFSKRSPEAIHGSLLALEEILTAPGSNFMKLTGRGDDVAKYIIGFFQNKDKLVKRCVVRLIPILAQFYGQEFYKKYYLETMKLLFSIFKNSNLTFLRDSAYLSIGRMCVEGGKETLEQCGDVKGEYIKKTVEIVVEGLTPKKGRLPIPNNLTCLAFLAETVRDVIKEDVVNLLKKDLFFYDGISRELVLTLESLSKSIPSLLKQIQSKLLDAISMILSKQPFSPVSSLEKSSLLPSFENPSDEVIALALKTLGAFNLKGYVLTDFVSECVVKYLSHDNSEIRKEAAKTCCTLLLSKETDDLIMASHTSISAGLGVSSTLLSSGLGVGVVGIGSFGLGMSSVRASVGEVLQKLLSVAISDPQSSIRMTVLSSLDERFDQFLSLSDNLSMFMIALNDESQKVREMAIKIIGRLTPRNPAFILASLRRILLQLLTKLEFCDDSKSKEESAQMLGNLIIEAPRLIKPYISNVYSVLRQNVLNSNSNVSSCVLDAFGKLSRVAGKRIGPFFDELLALIIQTLQDQSSLRKREVAIRTLGIIVKSTGSAITPYEKFPKLLTMLVDTLASCEQASLRKEVARVLGLIGAIDPYSHKMLKKRSIVDDCQTGLQEKMSDEAQLLDIPPQSDEYSPRVAFFALVKILKDSTLKSFHEDVIQAIIYIFRSLGLKCVPHLDKVMYPFFALIEKTTSMPTKVSLFQQLGVLVSIVKHHIRPYLNQIFTLINHNWDFQIQGSQSLSSQNVHVSNNNNSISNLGSQHPISSDASAACKIQIIALEEQLCLSLNEEFSNYLPQIIPNLNVMIRTDKSKDQKCARKGMHALRVFSRYLTNYLYLVIPCVVGVLDQQVSNDALIEEGIATIDYICCHLDTFEYSSRIVHPLVRLLHSYGQVTSVNYPPETVSISTSIIKLIMQTFTTLIYQLKGKFLLFVPLINKAIADIKNFNDVKSSIDAFSSLIGKLNSSKFFFEQPISSQVEPSFVSFPITQMTPVIIQNSTNSDSSNNVSSSQTQEIVKMTSNINNLKKAWEATHRSAKEDWMEWYRGLSVELLKESPSPALRSCSSLALLYQPLAKELFNAGFASCWNELDTKSREEVVRAIEMAFSSPTLPAEVLQSLLNVAEFMEHCEQPLPIAISSLGFIAKKCQCFAKALHYKEIEFLQSPATHIDALISINNKLHQHEAAIGILLYAQKHPDINFKFSWYEKLQRWDDALAGYLKKVPDVFSLSNNKNTQTTTQQIGNNNNSLQNDHSNQKQTGTGGVSSIKDMDSVLGIMRCLKELGKWGKLFELCKITWEEANKMSDDNLRKKLALTWTTCGFALSNWDFMEQSSKYLEENSQGFFFKAILSVHKREYKEALKLISKCRSLIDGDIGSVVGESYTRAYDLVIVLQQLVELEEVIEYDENEKKRELIRQTWDKRLSGITRNVKQWKNILSIRELVLPKSEMIDDYLTLCQLARDDGKGSISKRVLSKLLTIPFEEGSHPMNGKINEIVFDFDPEKIPEKLLDLPVIPKVFFHFMKHIYESSSSQNQKDNAVNLLSKFYTSPKCSSMPNQFLSSVALTLASWNETQLFSILENSSLSEPSTPISTPSINFPPLLSQSNQNSQNSSNNSSFDLLFIENKINVIVDHYKSATQYNPDNSLSWHNLALFYSQVANFYEAIESQDPQNSSKKTESDINDTLNTTNNTTVLEEEGEEDLDEEEPPESDEEVKEETEEGVSEEVEEENEEDSKKGLSGRRSFNSQKEKMKKKKKDIPKSEKFLAMSIHGFFQSIKFCSSSGSSNSKKFGRRDTSSSLESLDEKKGGSVPVNNNSETGDLLQDLLRLLTLWFTRGTVESVNEELKKGFKVVNVDYWLKVIPQIIARINSEVKQVKKLVERLLAQIGLKHPQALIYPLTVCTKSENETRKEESTKLLAQLKKHHPELIDQALQVSSELIRVAIIWMEQWHSGLEEASRLYFGEKNPEEMFNVLSPLHKKIKNPETLSESAFVASFGRDLHEAHKFCLKFKTSMNEADLNQAWDIYYAVFRRISKQLQHMVKLELKVISPNLEKMRNLALGIPGTYLPAFFNKTLDININDESHFNNNYDGSNNNNNQMGVYGGNNNITINLNGKNFDNSNINTTIIGNGNDNIGNINNNNNNSNSENNLSFGLMGSSNKVQMQQPIQTNNYNYQIGRILNKLDIINSKQRPRKVRMISMSGKEYLFLLKGHEDLRQDERVVQLFGLVNTLLANKKRNKSLNIKRFSVVPLSSNAGLLGWVSNCDTLHSLIKDYRDQKGMQLNTEHKYMTQMSNFYDHLTLMQKVEVFEYALNNTTVLGQDLNRILWLKSRTSEAWLDKRTNFSRSLAVMSMVGYVLGLGDRHPSNLMCASNFQIVHIDFGDCFEVAMNRDKFPEKVPFRLTRMLVNAMEVCGIEGTFRSTCETVMSVMRQNKSSVMAMLEAFVHDPLINWRLVEKPAQPNNTQPPPISQNQNNNNQTTQQQTQQQSKIKCTIEKKNDDNNNNTSTTVNKKALSVIKRIESKLNGTDFGTNKPLSISNQVHLLILQATSHSNLAQAYIGWCAFW